MHTPKKRRKLTRNWKLGWRKWKRSSQPGQRSNRPCARACWPSFARSANLLFACRDSLPVVDGRAEIVAEVDRVSLGLLRFVITSIQQLLSDPNFRPRLRSYRRRCPCPPCSSRRHHRDRQRGPRPLTGHRRPRHAPDHHSPLRRRRIPQRRLRRRDRVRQSTAPAPRDLRATRLRKSAGPVSSVRSDCSPRSPPRSSPDSPPGGRYS